MTDDFLDGKSPRPYSVEPASAPDDEIDLSKVILIAKRRWKLLFLGALVGLALGMAYASTTTKLYKASVQLSLDAREATNARELTGLQTLGMSESEITTEIEVIKSQAVAQKVVDRLSLEENTAFMQSPQTGLSRLRSLMRGALSPIQELLKQVSPDIPQLPISEVDQQLKAELAAVGKLRSNMTVTRLRDSRVVEVSFTSSSAALAATVANTLADVYIDDQLEAKYDATQRATDWLKERSDQLREESVQLDNAVERFKRENGLVGENGEASNTQFDRLSQQLSEARSQLVEQQARQRFLQDIIETGDTSAAVSSTSDQSITSGLRSRYLDVLKDYNSLMNRLGEEHEQTMRRKAELDQLQELLFEEIKRSEEIVRNEIVVTERRIEQLEQALEDAEAELGADRDLLVELRELERNASAVRSLYTSFLQKYQQSLQEQSFTVSNVRILNPAKVPGGASFPNTSRITVLSLVLGIMAASGWIAIAELRDKKVRTGEQIQRILGLEFLGGLQEVTGSKKISSTARSKASSQSVHEVAFPELLRYGLDKPLSSFAETLRAVKMSVTLRSTSSGKKGKGKVVGVFSAFPGEGKTTSSSNFANFLSSQGHSVIVIDADLRNPGLTKSFNKDIGEGLVDILQDGMDWQQAVHSDRETGLDVIPNKRGRVVHTSDLVGGDAMHALVEKLKVRYDFVILDLPPLAPVIDARATLPFLDGFVLVMKWGRTNIVDVERLFLADPRLREKCFGAVLNFFDARRARAYGYYSGDYYYGYAYKRYYSDR
ncbi:exopolysaccharide polymerization/transport protein [Roseobacter sp. AzwK-3b]|uniref:Wzz/FepE/Etk N-terminal domain-containing protein n=1 Tax=Roseobacter sp. AzwK-3b TaxID=351016 RepID=UPI000156AA82|nr:Wzz/FepE/Etk N-terminal domain-containing protein [Roseobacter sp. AzwK-3b]EDM69940.1 exopolysaccharide polymerization/transport protein [Roseobacter sp. AzwK-3b]